MNCDNERTRVVHNEISTSSQSIGIISFVGN